MGHTSATLTLNVYAHVTQFGERRRESLRALAEGRQWDRMGREGVQAGSEATLGETA